MGWASERRTRERVEGSKAREKDETGDQEEDKGAG